MKRKLFISLCLVVINAINVFGIDTICVNNNQFFIDVDKKLIVSNCSIDSLNSCIEFNDSISISFDGVLFDLTNPISKFELGIGYSLNKPSDSSNYTLYLTQLPLVSIVTHNNKKIVDIPNILGNFKLIESNGNVIESKIGIQLRGATAQTYPKKCFEIEFWDDSIGVVSHDYKLLGMTTSDKWNLQAMYNEPLRIRSKTNNDLWRKINALYYQNEEPDAINGIHMEYAELFLNGSYQGVYCVGEKVNRKQLKLKKYSEEKGIRGELYKGIKWGASTFTHISIPTQDSLTWLGLEYKHPDEKIDWTNMYNLVDFVINSTDENFYSNYKNRFEVDNLVDYYIFINLLRATDNMGKNMYLAKYDKGENYFYVPWDLDGSFGTIYNGTRVDITTDTLRNGLFDRLINDSSVNGFNDKLKVKWLLLRSSSITKDSLMSMFNENYNYLKVNGVYGREKLLWNGIKNPKNNEWVEYTFDKNELDYMSNWISRRLSYLDITFTKYNNVTTLDNDILTDDSDNGIYAVNGTVFADIDFEIFTISGINVTNSNGNLPYGIYIVKTNNVVHKITVQ